MQQMQLNANFFVTLAFFLIIISLIVVYVNQDFGTPLLTEPEAISKPAQPTLEQPLPIEQSAEQPITYADGKITERTIFIKNYLYEPNTVTISPGTKVTWINMDYLENVNRAWPHGVKIYGVNVQSRKLAADESFSYVFDTPGTYRFIDTLNPKTMEGTIIVLDEGNPEDLGALTGRSVTDVSPSNPMLDLLAMVILASIALGFFVGYKEE